MRETGEKGKKAKPIHEVRLGGVFASVWENVRPDGRIWYSVILEKRYLDRKDNRWKSSRSYTPDELQSTLEAGRQAVEWIESRRRDDE